MADNKPKWLKRLERESWQAEMIVSGAAIFGSLQLPALLTRAEHYLLIHFSDALLGNSLYIFFYLKMLVFGLVATFVLHFVVRALWIGMVGLNSIFPEGFARTERFSPDYQDKLRAEYGDIDGYIRQLDRLGSGIFGAGFLLTFMFLNFALLGSLVSGLVAWLQTSESPLLPDLKVILTVLAAFIFVFAFAQLAFHHPKMRDRAWVKRIHFPATKLFYRILYFLNSRYIVIGSSLFSLSNADRKGYWLYAVGVGLGVSLLMFPVVLTDSNLPLFSEGYYHRAAADASRVYPDSFEDTDHQGIYLRPQIASRSLPRNAAFTVWIPVPEREFYYLTKNCSVPEVDSAMERDERRRAEWARNVTCGKEYLTVALNGTALPLTNLRREYKTNAAGEQFGFRLWVDGEGLVAGNNQLTVTTAYPHPEDGRERVAYVNFYVK